MAQTVRAVGAGDRAAAISARDQAVLAVPGVGSASTRQRVTVGVTGVGAGSRAGRRQETVGGIIRAGRGSRAAVRLGQAVAYRIKAIALDLIRCVGGNAKPIKIICSSCVIYFVALFRVIASSGSIGYSGPNCQDSKSA